MKTIEGPLVTLKEAERLIERDLARVQAEDEFQADDCQHQWTESQIRTWKGGGSDVLILCSKCGANMELADFLTEVANGL